MQDRIRPLVSTQEVDQHLGEVPGRGWYARLNSSTKQCAAGAYFAGARNALLMQNHGFLASINGIVSLAMLYRIPLVMLIAHRGHFGESYPWHTQGGIVTEPVLRALGLPFEHARDPARVGQQIQDAQSLAWSSLGPVALLLSRELMED